LLPLFLACRAAVRAKTSATAARLATDDSRRAPLEAAAREYLTMAESLLRPAPPTLVAVGGLSGSGKTSMARRLAPSLGAVPGALVVRSDVVRKQLFDRDPLVRLPTSAYAADVTRRVYRALRARARAALGGGHAVIADAVFASPAERAAIERVARRAGVPFAGLWLEAPASLLRDRLQARDADASDATPAVLDRQLTQDPGDLDWLRIDASGDQEAVRAQIARHLGRPAGTHGA
jgi:predicted kinase